MSAELREIAEGIVHTAGAGEQIEAYLSTGRETSVKVVDGELESLTTATSSSVAIRVVGDPRQGIAVAGTLGREVIRATFAAARENAQYGTPDEHVRISTPDDCGDTSAPSLDVWEDDVLSTPTAEKIALVTALDAATRSRDPRVGRVESSEYGANAGQTIVCNSNGVSVARRRTSAGLSVVALADEGDAAYSGCGFSVRRGFASLDPEEATSRAVERAASLLGAKPIATTRLPVIFDPLVARSFVGLLAAMTNGDSVVRGRALFADRVGDEIAAPHVTLVEDPRNTDSFGATTTDSEGLATRAVTLIDGGVLRGFLHNLYTGSRSGSGSTASATRSLSRPPGVGVRALALKAGPATAEEIMQAAGDALYVVSLSGMHSGTNPVTGDFSVGAQGYMMRNGQRGEPVREVTIASTIPKMLLDLAMVGNDTTWLSGSTAGNTLLFSEMAVSGS